MKVFTAFLWVILLSVSCPVKSGIEDTIHNIEQKLVAGESVAILYIDMQTRFMRAFNAAEFASVIEGQLKLLSHFAGRQNVHFIDVNYKGQGATLSEALIQLKRNLNYKLFIKDEANAFGVEHTIPADGEVISDSQIQGELNEYLRSKTISEVMVTGCFDGTCVLQTVKGALDSGFNVSVDRQLNIIENLKSISRAFASPEEQAKALDTQWIELQEKFPKLTIIKPAEPGPCH
ncbi:isochorismatase family protein [Endozoicomonas arenosclerae]|uniref:isochorismatase family protein n=1 Tax=Endozoicomonas arenosclerae TaxID=1633495 RepID=UPI00078264AC|nr:isochorismatase family protein [Endozoicomonas arenosclerae]